MADLLLDPPESWDKYGAICRTVWLANVTYTDGSPRSGGELIWSPVESGSRADLLLPGWNAYADYDDLGRLAPNLYRTRICGLRTERAAIRALLAQLPINRTAWDARSAERDRRAGGPYAR